MKKHIYGLAIFLSIVGTAIFAYGYFKVQPIPVFTEVHHRNEPTYASDRAMKDVAARVLIAEYDARTGALAADVELKWNGAGSPPDRLEYRVFLSDATPSPHWALESNSVREPFSGSRRIVERVTFLPSAIATFGNFDNIYMYVEAAGDPTTLASLEQRLSNSMYVPVLKVHN